MNYLNAAESRAIYNLYEFAGQMASEYPDELSLLYNEILKKNIDPLEYNSSQNAAFIFDCLQTNYSGTLNNLAKSIADNSVNETQSIKFGCTSPDAENYDPDATNNDGSCIVNGERGLRCIEQYTPCECEYYSYDPGTCCHDECDGEGYPQGDDFCDDPNDDNYGYYGGCTGGNSDGIGLLNTLTAIGNALWGVVEAIGVDVIYDDIVNGNQNSLNTGGSNQSCPPGQVRCKKNGIDGCNASIDCDTTKKEKSYTWLYVTLGVLAVGGLGYLIYKKNK